MKRVMVTGASGFVGSALCAHLARAQYRVIGVVRRVSDPIPSVTYIEADLTHHQALSQKFPAVDCLIHLAGRAHVLVEHVKDPLAAFREVNRDATLRLAQRALDAGVKRFVFISSIGVNGNRTLSEPFREGSPVNPQAPYAVSKWETEVRLKALLEGTAMELVIVRPPLIYSEASPGNFGSFLKLIRTGVPLPFGNVTNKRSLISRLNVVEFLQVCVHHPDAAGELFLVSDGQDVSTPEMVKIISQGMRKSTNLFSLPLPWLEFALSRMGKASMYRQLCGSLQVDASKAKDLLGWVPTGTTPAGLEEVGRKFRYFRRRRG
ncbi:NAD-dependent epimerase/dehydratase family protein [Pseudomonas plecoglossicida]|uniref:NAD-dependent epimerase/dehydratase family protein n=1 Tax=Pseudomonas plecoglossicida TaxID=70775 RepID=UPI00215933B5|nr:NAD-dependent epimerase/dehydratase family protein [Pseudomonas plecoglossicida]